MRIQMTGSEVSDSRVRVGGKAEYSNTVFRNCVIEYEGEFPKLKGCQFIGCTFVPIEETVTRRYEFDGVRLEFRGGTEAN